jgi:hypothetical protein
MLQNIVKHGEKKENETGGNPGIFFISELDHGYMLSTGNYVKKSKVLELSEKIDYVNSIDGEELDDFYTRRLLNFDIDNSLEAGLGIIDLRMKSGNTLLYSFSDVNDSVSFFSLQVTL